ncbi:hypothetical protein MTR_4g451315 [Medicago truncatula]|uniref:Uncharacterized protein n=1 Tax=Medicago truncatula TaxID=3880 RepID=A0A072UV48_MEDTR|nr:hypothetical protein MTR_4g451315 [Medicago truncatula]
MESGRRTLLMLKLLRKIGAGFGGQVILLLTHTIKHEKAIVSSSSSVDWCISSCWRRYWRSFGAGVVCEGRFRLVLLDVCSRYFSADSSLNIWIDSASLANQVKIKS